MASTPFPVEVLTPEGEVFNEEVVQISTKTTVGSLGILAKHQPMLAMLDPTELRLYRSDSDVLTLIHVLTLIQGEGYLQVQRDGRVLILVDEAGTPDSFDRSEWEDRLKRAEDELSDAEEKSHQAETAARDKRRAEAVLEVLDRN
jgi:F-type H+-transporting ATPase subunit epsilon